MAYRLRIMIQVVKKSEYGTQISHWADALILSLCEAYVSYDLYFIIGIGYSEYGTQISQTSLLDIGCSILDILSIAR